MERIGYIYTYQPFLYRTITLQKYYYVWNMGTFVYLITKSSTKSVAVQEIEDLLAVGDGKTGFIYRAAQYTPRKLSERTDSVDIVQSALRLTTLQKKTYVLIIVSIM